MPTPSRRVRATAWRTRSLNSARLARWVTRVVEGLVGELLLERLALGDVAAVEHDPADRAVGQQVGVEDLEVAQAAVLVGQQAVDHLGAAGGAGAVGEAAQQPALLVGMEQLARTSGPVTSSAV